MCYFATGCSCCIVCMNRIIWQEILLCHHLGSRDWLKWYGDCWSGWKIGWIAFKFRRIYKWLKTRYFRVTCPPLVRSFLWLYDPRYKDIRTCSHGRWPSLVSAGGQDFTDVSTCSSLSSRISSSSLLRYVLVHLQFCSHRERWVLDSYCSIVLCLPSLRRSVWDHEIVVVRTFELYSKYKQNTMQFRLLEVSFRQSQRAVVQLRCLSVCTAVLQTGCTSICVFLRPMRGNVSISVRCDLVLCAPSLFAVALLHTLHCQCISHFTHNLTL